LIEFNLFFGLFWFVIGLIDLLLIGLIGFSVLEQTEIFTKGTPTNDLTTVKDLLYNIHYVKYIPSPIDYHGFDGNLLIFRCGYHHKQFSLKSILIFSTPNFFS